jgi:hypothetical protein
LGRVRDGIANTYPQNMHPDVLKNIPVKADDVVEHNFKNSASNISDNTHTGEHWDGPKRGRIIRAYRKDLDTCNISGNGKCSKEELKALAPK